MYCLSIYLIQIQSYPAFPNMAVEHWCLSLKSFPQLSTIIKSLASIDEEETAVNIFLLLKI